MFAAVITAKVRAYWRAVAFGVLIGLLGLLFWQYRIDTTTRGADIDRTDSIGWLLRLRAERPPPDNVVIVDIVQPFDDLRPELAGRPEWRDCLVQSQGQVMPETKWPRCAIAVLLDDLRALGASEVVFDVFFDDPRPGGQEQLAQAIARAQNVVLQEWCRPLTPAEAWRPWRAPRLRPGTRRNAVPGCGHRLIPPLPELISASAASGPM